MPMRIAIVGGGIVGIAICLAALQRGFSDVTIFDKNLKLECTPALETVE